MDAWQEDQIHSLLTLSSEGELFEHLKCVAAALGFDYCAYGIRMPLPVSNPRVELFNNYPQAWQDTYRLRNYLAVDPTVRHALQSTLPLAWSDELFASAREMWEEARGYGLVVGWAQPSRDAGGSVGLLTLARSHDSVGRSEYDDKVSQLAWLAHVAHVGMSRHLSVKLVPEAAVKLSDREREILRWTAEGKTSGEVADILNISERTVNFHIANAIAKMGANNKTQAAIRAAVLGLL